MRKGQRLKRRSLRSSHKDPRDQRRTRKEKNAKRAKGMAGRLVRHRLMEDLTKMIPRMIQGQARAKMTANA